MSVPGSWKQKFYLSREWRHMRAFVINRDKRFCQMCGEFITGVPEVDHIVELTEENYTDPAVSLNPELLRTLHRSCHNKRHNRFGQFDKETIVDDELNINYSKRAPL